MATLESMAIRSNAACDRIEARLQALGVDSESLPRLMRDREMLRCVQLEAIAAALEDLPAMQEEPAPVAPVIATPVVDRVYGKKPTPQTGKRK